MALKAYIALIYAACCSLPYVSFASLSSATTVQWQLVFWQTKFPIKKGALLEKRLEHKQQREEQNKDGAQTKKIERRALEWGIQYYQLSG